MRGYYDSERSAVLKRSDFNYHLPEGLIAKFPPEQRGDSRLLLLDGCTGALTHKHFSDMLDLLQAGDLIVFNDTRVMAARIYGRKQTGAKLEILIERLLDDRQALVHMRCNKSPKAGAQIELGDEGRSVKATVIGRRDALFELELESGQSWMDLMDAAGHMPLPPYIDRDDQSLDEERYQTVYARTPGAVAAPTAGLHFTDELLAALTAKGVEQAFVTLHVGAGTFQPVKADDIREHAMHSEYLELTEAVCEQVRATRARGGRVIAVGTTAVRCLETATDDRGQIQPYFGDTAIFIYPGYRFKCIDALITNFHLPESTLIMLVSALAGRDHTLFAYEQAVDMRYRFFSYGDAMFVTPAEHARIPR